MTLNDVVAPTPALTPLPISWPWLPLSVTQCRSYDVVFEVRCSGTVISEVRWVAVAAVHLCTVCSPPPPSRPCPSPGPGSRSP